MDEILQGTMSFKCGGIIVSYSRYGQFCIREQVFSRGLFIFVFDTCLSFTCEWAFTTKETTFWSCKFVWDKAGFAKRKDDNTVLGLVDGAHILFINRLWDVCGSSPCNSSHSLEPIWFQTFMFIKFQKMKLHVSDNNREDWESQFEVVKTNLSWWIKRAKWTFPLFKSSPTLVCFHDYKLGPSILALIAYLIVNRRAHSVSKKRATKTLETCMIHQWDIHLQPDWLNSTILAQNIW